MVIRSKLLPPQPHRGIFRRERILQRLNSAVRSPLTLVHAGTGFGKTTALSDVLNFLAQEVLQRQPENVQHFLLSSAVLRQLDANACNALSGITVPQYHTQCWLQIGYKNSYKRYLNRNREFAYSCI
jgi:ATP/maltotriose-dependent transcriptional regulator MalT